MNENGRTHHIVTRRTLSGQLLVDREKLFPPTCPTRSDYSYGGGRCPKPRYCQKTSAFPTNRTALASTFSIFASFRVGKRRSPPGTTAEDQPTEGHLHCQCDTATDAARCDTLEHSKHGQSSWCQQCYCFSNLERTQSQTASDRNVQTQPRSGVRTA